MAAFNADGKVVAVNDEVSILGLVVSLTGSGGTAVVTVQPLLTTSTITANANDMNAVDHPNDSDHVATSISGKHFGQAGERVSVLGTVTAVSGSTLTVLLCASGGSVTVPAGSCRSAQFNG